MKRGRSSTYSYPSKRPVNNGSAWASLANIAARTLANNAIKAFTSSAGATTSNTAFNNSNSRVSTNTLYRKRRRRKLTKKGLKARKRKYRFNKRVRRAVRTKQEMSMLFESQSGTTSAAQIILNDSTSTANTSSIVSLKNGYQLIFGDDGNWGVHLGELWGTGVDNTYIAREQSDFRLRINATDITATNDQMLDTSIFVKYKRHNMSIANKSTVNDVIFDLYTFVAASDIADADYRSPVATWVTLQNNSNTTGVLSDLRQKGMTPLDQPRFGKWWKLLEKKKVIIPFNSTEGIDPYQTFTMYGKKTFFNYKDWTTLYAKKGVTKMYMLILSPDLMDSVWTSGSGVPVANVYVNRCTHYKPVNRAGQHAQTASVQSRTTLVPATT